MKDDVQNLFAEIGEAGCYALCLCSVAEEYFQRNDRAFELDVHKAIQLGIEKKCIYYNHNDKNDNDNMYVNYPELFLFYLTGKHWSVTKVDSSYAIKSDNEFLVDRYERIKTGAVIGHFERKNFKPIKNSLTVQYGKLVSRRLCKVND